MKTDLASEISKKSCIALVSFGKDRIGRTSEGYVGAFPPGMEAGDVVCLLKGSTVPCLLRPCGDDYLFVGGCFVPGISPSEAWELVKSGKRKFKLSISVRKGFNVM